MPQTVISVENISKSYILRHQQREKYLALRDVMASAAKSVFSGTKSKPGMREEFWALKDVSFDVQQGDRIGIIGRNGAGKSTLLKILSRIVTPTKGRIVIEGRVASLLEVGTGFHPELTGRENIFLNGSILGMSKAEIRSKFDEIVSFAEVEKFLDTPVKRYSSGMYVRLAFAVAAHLEPEILIVDEVLAVGDAEFQKKCLGKMRDVAGQGRTVLFVSHNMAAIQNLCSKAVLLSSGKLEMAGETDKIISAYLSTGYSTNAIPVNQRTDRQGDGRLVFTGVSFHEAATGKGLSEIQSGADVRIRLHYSKNADVLKDVAVTMGINDEMEQRICLLSNDITAQRTELKGNDKGYFEVEITKFPLAPGKYNVTLFCSSGGEITDWIQNAFYFDVCSGDFYGTGKELPGGQGNFLLNYSFIN